MTYFLDERIILPFHRVNETGVYRYDVYKGDELIFVGNIYCVANNKDVQIDITDVARRYYQNQIPFSETPEESPVLTTFNVEFLGDQTEVVSQDVYMIYRQPNFNSNVTTPIGDNDILLQGDRGFLPTYPIIPSTNLTFDCIYNNTDKNSITLSTYYKKDNVPVNFSIEDLQLPNTGLLQFSLPLNEIVKNQYTTTEEIGNTRKYVASGGHNGWETYEWQGDNTNSEDDVNANICTGVLSDLVDTITVEVTYLDPQYGASIEHIPTLENTDSKYLDLTTSYAVRRPKKISFYFRKGNELGSYTEVAYLEFILVNTDIPDGFQTHILFQQNKETKEAYFGFAFEEKKVYEYTPCELESINIGYAVAKFDKKSRYFLKWRDRYGMSQIQPFKGTYLYSENISRNKIINYKNTSKLVDSTNQGKWMINTDWISQDLYPFYESIFVSPWLQLYDAKEDKLYNVILSNTEYEEKTFNNQNRQLFNLQLEVELDTTQNIIY